MIEVLLDNRDHDLMGGQLTAVVQTNFDKIAEGCVMLGFCDRKFTEISRLSAGSLRYLGSDFSGNPSGDCFEEG
jgi:hypothetical protein